MCKSHWSIVPAPLKRSVLREYRNGQCQLNPVPSPQWHDAANAAIFWVYAAELKRENKSLRAQLADKEQRLMESLGYTKADGRPNLPTNTVVEIPLLIKKGVETGTVDQFKWEGDHVYYRVVSRIAAR